MFDQALDAAQAGRPRDQLDVGGNLHGCFGRTDHLKRQHRTKTALHLPLRHWP